MKSLKKLFKRYKIDGYIIPKNDEYFNEYVHLSKDRLKFVSNFSGSAGFAIILKNKNYLFVDGRYTIQARYQSGKKFKIITVPNKLPKDILKSTTIASLAIVSIAQTWYAINKEKNKEIKNFIIFYYYINMTLICY